MQNELRERTLVAAETAKEHGFVHTYEALVALLKMIEHPDSSPASPENFEQTDGFYPS